MIIRNVLFAGLTALLGAMISMPATASAERTGIGLEIVYIEVQDFSDLMVRIDPAPRDIRMPSGPYTGDSLQTSFLGDPSSAGLNGGDASTWSLAVRGHL